MNKTFIKLFIAAIFAQNILSATFNVNSIQAYAMDKNTPSKAVLAVENTVPVKEDLRVKALQIVLERHNSPLAPFAGDYVKTADKYGMDWKLLPAISGLESSFGLAQMPGSYNSYGWGGGLIYFKSNEDGIETVLSNLKTNYVDQGATTVEAIAPIYSESPTWAPRVRNYMDEIDLEYSKLKTATITLTI
jgi:hypothetical protein